MSHTVLDLADQSVLVTGGTGGIGKATATALSRRGATVIVVGRSEERGEAAVREIVEATGNDAVEFRAADLSSLGAVRQLAREIREDYDRLDVLVNNVGALSAERRETVDGYEATVATNLLSPFLLTDELLPLLAESTPARIVNVNTTSTDLPWPFASFGVPDLDDLSLEDGYNGMKAYFRAKTANLAWTYELARRLEGSGIAVYAVNPGGADTAMQSEAIAAAPLPMRVVGTLLGPLLRRFGNTSLEAAAASTVYAATAPELANETGLFLDPDGIPVTSSSASRDEELARRIWAVAVDLTGIESDRDRPSTVVPDLT